MPASTLNRAPGWEQRLAAVLRGAARRPYVLGEHDCFRFACASLEALTGVDRWPEFAGRYRTERQALRVIAERGSDYTAAMSWFFGRGPEPIGFAQRGDVAELGAGLGVVCGAHVAVLSDSGLTHVKRSGCRHAWRIG